jgi:prepilin-type N-terminal cleavage/methylation domain-containing protein
MQLAKEHGFSLIELLIVVAIILIIAAIAIPNLLQARIAANESSAANTVRQIVTAEAGYNMAYPTIGYAVTLTNLGGPSPCPAPIATAACMLDNSIANAIPGTSGKSGYQFQATGLASGGLNVNFVAGATPVNVNLSGNRNFCALSDGAFHILIGGGGTPVTTAGACQAYPIAQ